MDIIGTGIDLVKASREWREEYEIQHDKDLYIHRITDLNKKLCLENEKLKQNIIELQKGKLSLNNDHYEILKIFDLNQQCTIGNLKKLYNENIDLQIALAELEDEHYLTEVHSVVPLPEDEYKLEFSQDKKIEILKFIKAMQI